MNLMRKLRDQGKFRNSMLAEIEADERVEVPKKSNTNCTKSYLIQALQSELKKTEKIGRQNSGSNSRHERGK